MIFDGYINIINRKPNILYTETGLMAIGQKFSENSFKGDF